jgi:hypothetical protein
MLFKDIIPVQCEKHTIPVYTNSELLLDKAGGAYSNNWDLKG